MLIPNKQLRSGFSMPVFGIGTWQMGGRDEHDLKNNDQADITAIKTAIDLGVNHIDTAEIYADGYAEIIVSQAIKNYNRHQLFLVSKVQAKNLKFDDVINACKKSLSRLKTDYLDLYLAHRFNPNIELQETIEALNELVKLGLVKNIGVSNYNVNHLQTAQKYSKNKIVCNQVHYNLMYREPEKSGLLEYCQKNDVFLVAWRPLGKGNLLNNPDSVLKKLTEKYKKTPAQIAINWLISQTNVVTLTKTSNLLHLKENLGAIGWQMEPNDIEDLKNNFSDQKFISDVVPLG